MREILDSYTEKKRKKSSLWARVFSRPVSFPLTYFFINIGFSANAMSVFSMIEELIAFAFILIGGKLLPWGIGLYILWHALDCCDGNIARVKGTSSYSGEFFDAASGYIAPAFIYLTIGVTAFRTTSVSASYSYWFIVLGAVASISDLLGRIIYQKFVVTEYRLGLIGQKGNIDEQRKSGIRHLFDVITKNLAYSSLFMPLLIFAYIFNKFDVLITVYGIYCFALMLVILFYFVLKGQKFDQRVKEMNRPE